MTYTVHHEGTSTDEFHEAIELTAFELWEETHILFFTFFETVTRDNLSKSKIV